MMEKFDNKKMMKLLQLYKQSFIDHWEDEKTYV